MAAIKGFDAGREAAALPTAVVDGIKDALSLAAWRWFVANQNNRLFTVSIWIVKKTFYWRDVEPFVRLIFGPNPYSVTRGAPKGRKLSRLLGIEWHLDQ